MVDAFNVEIVGSDIDSDALADARIGDYGERALARMPADVVERYFEPPHGGRRRIIRDLQESVAFTPANLVEEVSKLLEHDNSELIATFTKLHEKIRCNADVQAAEAVVALLER